MTAAVGSTSNEYSFDTFTSGNTHTNMNYELETLPFTITSGGSFNLSFTSDDAAGSPYGPVIGGVDISAVPEPSPLSVMLAGLALIGGAMYFGRKKIGGAKA